MLGIFLKEMIGAQAKVRPRVFPLYKSLPTSKIRTEEGLWEAIQKDIHVIPLAERVNASSVFRTQFSP